MPSFARFFAFVILAATMSLAQEWVIRKDGRPMTGMASSGKTLVVYGKGAGLWVKEDGKSWVTVRIPGNRTIIDMVWTGTMFAGITQPGYFVHSTDGKSWSVRTGVLSTGRGWSRILWMNDSFTVFSGITRIARVSKDFGSTEFDTRFGHSLKRALVDHDTCYLVWSTNGIDSIASSVDFRTWTRRTSPAKTIGWLSKDKDGWIAIKGDTLLRSADLRSWSPTPMVDTTGKPGGWVPDHVQSAGGKLWGTTKNLPEVFESVDGAVWRKSFSIKGNVEAVGLTLATTASGTYALAFDDVLLRMPDSVRGWTTERDHMVNYLQGVAYKNNAIHVYGNYFAHLSSRNGIDWTIERGLHEFAPMGWSAVADFGDDRLFPLGRTLSMLPTADTNVMIDEMPRCGWAGGGRRVIVGDDGMLAVSDDGKVWQDLKLASKTDLRSGLWHGGLHVIVGDTILTSSDGLDWRGRTRPMFGQVALSSVAWGAGRWVAMGGGVEILSEDGITWDIQVTGIRPMAAVRYGGGKFVAVGLGGVVLSSSNGLSWDSTDIGADVELDDVAWTGAGWVAVGQYGMIATLGSPVVPPPVSTGARSPLPLQARWNGRFLSTPAGTVSVDLVDPSGRILSLRPDGDGRIDLRALPSGFWIARGTGAQAWTVRLVR